MILIVLAVIFYFLPSAIAITRHTKHSGAIFAINFFFGWTILGWIAALIWAIVETPEEPKPTELPWSDKPIPVNSGKKYETYYHPPEE
jgi:hypothetical protein